MGKKSQKKKDRRLKKDILEQLTAWMHEEEGTKVEMNVRLRPPGIGKKPGREIDVLLTRLISGKYEIRIPIECKNWSRPVEAKEVEAFSGKLQTLGFPKTPSVFVTTSRYTKGARESAEQSGMELLVFSGLDKQRIAPRLLKASQNLIFLAPALIEVSVRAECDQFRPEEMLLYTEPKEDAISFAFLDVLHFFWLTDTTEELKLGRYSITATPKLGCFQRCRDDWARVLRIEGLVHVEGILIEKRGRYKEFSLTDAKDDQVRSFKGEASFSDERKEEIRAFAKEEDLQGFIDENRAHIALNFGRFKIPRFLLGDGAVWPFPRSIVAKVAKATQEKGDPPDPREIESIIRTSIGLDSLLEPLDPRPFIGSIRDHELKESILFDWKMEFLGEVGEGNSGTPTAQ